MYICITVMNMFSNGVVSASVDVSKTSSTLAASQHAACSTSESCCSSTCGQSIVITQSDTSTFHRASSHSEAAHSQDGRGRKRRALQTPAGTSSGAAASDNPVVGASAATASTHLARLPAGSNSDSQAQHSWPHVRGSSAPGTSAPSPRPAAYGDLTELMRNATVRHGLPSVPM